MILLEDKIFQDGINFLASILQKQHNEQFNWAKSIYDNQQNLKKSLGINDASIPWEPYYNRSVPLNSQEPEIYNKYGEKFKVVFLSDREGAHVAYGGGRHVFFDRYNYGLKIHLYSHDEAFRLVGNPDKRFAYLIESRMITPQSYTNYLKNKEYMENNFECVFTYDEEVLNTIKNAKFAPLCASVWYGKTQSFMAENVQLGGGYLLKTQPMFYQMKVIKVKIKISQSLLLKKEWYKCTLFAKHWQ